MSLRYRCNWLKEIYTTQLQNSQALEQTTV
jgi:hypothetical protein